MGSTSTKNTDTVLQPVLNIASLSKRFGSTVALAELNMQVSEGDIVALLGESGSGKTTLLRLIAGFEQPSEGNIILNGKQVASSKHTVPAEKRGLGMVFQDYALFPHKNVSQNVAYGLRRLDPATKSQRIADMLELVGLSGLEKRFPHELSGGQQQRVALARALAPNPSLLLLDEPFSNLDESLKAQVRKDLKLLLRQLHTTAIFVTHDTKDALTTADHILVLKDGMLQQEGTPQELYQSPQTPYVAEYFGPVNWLTDRFLENHLQPIGNNSRSIGFRPIHCQPAAKPPTSSDIIFPATLEDLSFSGEYWEARLTYHQDTTLISWIKNPANLVVGESSMWQCPSESLIYC